MPGSSRESRCEPITGAGRLISINDVFCLYSEADFGVWWWCMGIRRRPIHNCGANRIGIDTGAVYGGRLTCAVLEDDRVAFLYVSGNGRKPMRGVTIPRRSGKCNSSIFRIRRPAPARWWWR